MAAPNMNSVMIAPRETTLNIYSYHSHSITLKIRSCRTVSTSGVQGLANQHSTMTQGQYDCTEYTHADFYSSQVSMETYSPYQTGLGRLYNVFNYLEYNKFLDQGLIGTETSCVS